MSSKYWLLFGSLALGAAQLVACSSEFSACEARRTCPAGGAAGMAGAAGADAGEAGADEGGSAGLDGHAGAAGTAEEAAGSAGSAGDTSADLELQVASPDLAAGKTYVPFTGKISASGAARYTWSIASGSLPAGLSLQGVQSATVTIDGTPTEAGQFPLSLTVTDGSTTKGVDVTLTITHSALFLSDRKVAGVNELFVAEIGAGEAAEPVQLSASIPSGGGVSNYAWSPDGSKVLYIAKQSAGGAAELWVTSLASPGTPQRVSAAGVTVSKMVWLAAGDIGAYTNGSGDAYLVDLSGPTPGASKSAFQESTYETGALAPSPNGTSLLIGTSPPQSGTLLLTYVSWAAGTPKSVPVGAGQAYPAYSYDGRFVSYSSSGFGKWSDLSMASPTAADLGYHFSGTWSPVADALLFASTDPPEAPVQKLFRGAFSSGSLTTTELVSASRACKSMYVSPWSPDAKNGVFTCERDLRGISNVATAPLNADFSVLPSGFLANAFTDISNTGWSPDSQWLALRADREVSNQSDLYLIRWSAPGTAYKPHANSIAPGVTTWSFAPNSQSVAFVGTIAPQNNTGLYLSKLPSSGPPPTATLASAPASSVVQTDINWLPGSRVIAYRATVSGAAQLFAVPVAADGTAGNVVSISGVSGGGVSSYQLAPAR